MLVAFHNYRTCFPIKENIFITDENIIPTLDESILSALGNTFNTDKVYGEDIHPEIMKRFENILTCGLKKEIKEEIIKKYLIPANGKLLDAPKLNVELQGLLTELVKARDKKVEERQQQLGTALATISYIMDTLVKGNFNKINTITILTDVTKLLSDLHWEDTVTRRKLIAANLDKNIVKSVDSSIRYSFLFGEKFNENVKSANAIKKSAASILKPSNINTQKPNNKNRSHGIQLLGNYQGPPRQGQYKQGGGEGRYQQRTSVRLQQRRPAAKAYHPARRPVRQS
ncbi:uncharacterized protein LOC128201971 [Galleria mellonella]|uniref:Uncharacterized protein LOC128201971 n=1 Tax=Galleria mellonella TaxID=7137 RepID=A0ABM3MYX0_GALME|nr:uncharacterized protein LOC128201971 [Galleria mellonella]